MRLNFLIVLLCVSITACALTSKETKEDNVVMFGNELKFTMENE